MLVAVVVGLALGVAGLLVLIRSPATAATAPAPPPVAPAPVPERTTGGLDLPTPPTGVPTAAPTGPVETLVMLLGAHPVTRGVYSPEQVRVIARWSCRRIAAWPADPAAERVALWRQLSRRYGLPEVGVGPLVTGVLEPVCSGGRGDAV